MRASAARVVFSLIAALAMTLTASQRAPAAVYDFLTVAGNGQGGNSAFSQFNSNNLNGFITVSHSFPNGGVGASDDLNTAIFPSNFTNVFPGTGNVQGHLAQTVYGHTSVVTFDLQNYNLSSSTVFGMWNTSDEVTAPPGGNPVYRVQLIDSSNNQVSPTTFSIAGKGDNLTQVAGRHEMDLNPLTGEITPGLLLNNGGTHTSATFWDQIPAGTKKIIVYADLPNLNLIGDGVGYYFAEVVPEPATLGMLMVAGLAGLRRVRRR